MRNVDKEGVVFSGVVSTDIVSQDLLDELQLFLDVLRRLSSTPPHTERVRQPAIQRHDGPHRLVSVLLLLITINLIYCCIVCIP